MWVEIANTIPSVIIFWGQVLYKCFLWHNIFLFFNHHPNPHTWVYKIDPRCCLYWKFLWCYVWSVFQARNAEWVYHCKFLLENIAHGVMSVSWKWEVGVWNQGIFMILLCLLIDIIPRNYTRSYNIQSFSYPYVGVIFDKYIWSRSHKLAYVHPTGTLDSCSRTQKEQKNTQNTVIEVQIRTLYT